MLPVLLNLIMDELQRPTTILLSVLSTATPQNRPPSETGRGRANEDFNHTGSFGNAFPVIDTVSPCTTTAGVTFNSITPLLL